ncbi:MAG: asparagine synthase (glutamine-hydrolyzing) [Candidatus Scalindua rubra]|uniref:asparagine synthase (glutamine-hydrolyzing) n=1 Tax=Candidatus Scalindua brodae TaxID=237368 RepID=A0A0B0EIS4_9BACT|nr:MAG: asparagine synthase [Candidatus Scalindua brodae]MBZ0110436.1 asparagine synthase (glutamine-hydrolyzing) [Candidatus Scalindua rubra]TWU36270.1 Asparagine synthetase [glutamine-hydrolyzing] 1 [Candidatus Brocadiaceae bacterium S225]
MCGICGKLSYGGVQVDETLLRKMCRSLFYRGPDDEGVFVSSNSKSQNSKVQVGLGHTRLSVIDLSDAGHQPMCNEEKTIWLVCNGEIYNFEEIRTELKEKGHRFRSNTDSEVIIHLYEEEGIDCLKRLNGMFAFCIWDERLQKLWLCRDRLGIKPLVYYWDGETLIFSSEIKGILCDSNVRKEIDWTALDLYLTFNYIPAPKTIFENIRKLEPGYYLLAERKTVVTRKYWDIDTDITHLQGKPDRSSDQIGFYKERLYELMENSVQKRMISDVQLGAFLSGGIDSSIIVGLMARNSERPVKTFSIGYKDMPLFDETKYAREVATFNKTEHYEFKLNYKDILDSFPDVLETLDEPFADSSAVPTYIVSRETKRHVTVALAGDGADELFAGYRMYQGEYMAKYYSVLPRIIKEKIIGPFTNFLPDSRDRKYSEYMRRFKKFTKGMSVSLAERFYGWQEIFPFNTRRQLIKKHLRDKISFQTGQEIISQKLDKFTGDNINRMLYVDVKNSLPGDMLTKVDLMSMRNSLEVRAPFLDHEIVEFAFKMEGEVKLKGLKRKYILIETFKNILPPMLHNRAKWGFEMPIGAWLKNELKFLIDEFLSKDVINKQNIFEYEVIDCMIKKHLSNKVDYSWHLWNLIVFQHWFKRYFQ